MTRRGRSAAKLSSSRKCSESSRTPFNSLRLAVRRSARGRDARLTTPSCPARPNQPHFVLKIAYSIARIAHPVLDHQSVVHTTALYQLQGRSAIGRSLLNHGAHGSHGG